jgi:hypothetical protein
MLSTFAVAELAASSSVNNSVSVDAEVKSPEVVSPDQNSSPPVLTNAVDQVSMYFPFNLFPTLKRDASSNDEDGDKSDADLQPKPAKRRRKPDCEFLKHPAYLTVVLIN